MKYVKSKEIIHKLYNIDRNLRMPSPSPIGHDSPYPSLKRNSNNNNWSYRSPTMVNDGIQFRGPSVPGTLKGIFKTEGMAITDINLQVIEISSLDINLPFAFIPLPMHNIRGVHPNINNKIHTEGIIGHHRTIRIEILLIMELQECFPLSII